MPSSVEAARAYHQQFKGSPAEEYIRARGLESVAQKLRFGYVGSALTGYEQRAGMLVIPYLRPAAGPHGVATVRFRCIEDACVKDEVGDYLAPTRKENHHSHKKWYGKYWGLPGDVPRIYNTTALISQSPFIVVTEGEFDTGAWESVGVPAIAYQGTSSWRDYFIPPLIGFETVYVIADGDEPGTKAAEKIAALIPNAKVIVLPDGHDSNSFLHAYGADALRERIGL
ncbi:toprim domain-containing protein [Streptomyces sp. NPDC001118]|uniref:toprim domain-containing protein n=1 Tax=Streptomyces sp. NPDC001127 TaxID=3154377 RepID=UPI00331ABC15